MPPPRTLLRIGPAPNPPCSLTPALDGLLESYSRPVTHSRGSPRLAGARRDVLTSRILELLVARLFMPSLLFLAMVGFYLLGSHAPSRVHIYSIACLLAGFWLPAVIAGNRLGLRKTLRWWPIPIIVSMLAWDASPILLGGKPEPFFIARHSLWLYPVGFAVLAALTALSAFLASSLGSVRE